MRSTKARWNSISVGSTDTSARKVRNPPIGLILCAGKRQETVELLNLERCGIKVSAYWTEALSKTEMERKLHEAVLHARARIKLVPP
jgi:hypothetical protein